MSTTNKFTEFQLEVLEKKEIDCIDFVALLGDRQDGDLPPSLEGRLHAHMAVCRFCSEFEASYRQTVELARELPQPQLPAGARNRLRQALNQRLGIQLPLVE